MNGFHGGEGTEHHADFRHFEGGQEEGGIAARHIDICLGEEFKNIQQQVFILLLNGLVEILQVVGEVDLVGDPMHLLLHFIGFKCPVVFKGLVVGSFF